MRILQEPRSALTKQYEALLATEQVTLEFKPDAVEELARIATEVNRNTENIGARRLHTVMERLLEGMSFEASDHQGQVETIDAAYVDRQLAHLARDEDMSRYIL